MISSTSGNAFFAKPPLPVFLVLVPFPHRFHPPIISRIQDTCIVRPNDPPDAYLLRLTSILDLLRLLKKRGSYLPKSEVNSLTQANLDSRVLFVVFPASLVVDVLHPTHGCLDAGIDHRTCLNLIRKKKIVAILSQARDKEEQLLSRQLS